MVAESHIYNPSIFTDQKISCFDIFREYILLLKEYQRDLSLFRNHFYKIFHKILEELPDYRERIHKIKSIEEGEKVIVSLEEETKKLSNYNDIYYLQPRIRGEVYDAINKSFK